MRAAWERIQKADHFEALGLKREAASGVIKATYFALAKSWHPDAGGPDDPAEGKRLRADLFARIGEAWAVLGDEAQRKQYLDDLKTGAASTVDVSAIFEAEDLFQRAQVLERTRQYPLALQELDKAIQLNDKEPEFHVLRAWVRFLVAQDRKAQLPRSAGEIEAALKELPNCKSGHLFLGRMAKVVGDLGLAEKYLKRGLQVLPDDSELQRELRYLRK
jgi:curved DNA-binding protein CbpA